MTLALWLSLLTASIIISFTPGAGAINTMSNSLTVGWRRSGWGVVGQQVALLAHILIVAAGVGVIVAGSPLLFGAIRYIGAAYLVYLGVRLILARPTAQAEEVIEAEAARSTELPYLAESALDGSIPVKHGAPLATALPESAWSLIRRGFWVNILNPKAVVFFLAFIPQFIRVSEPLLPQYAILTATVVVVDVIVMWGFFAAAARPFGRYTADARGQRVLNTVFGVLFIAVAGLLLFIH